MKLSRSGISLLLEEGVDKIEINDILAKASEVSVLRAPLKAANAYLALAGYQILLTADTLVIFLMEVSMKNIAMEYSGVLSVVSAIIFTLTLTLTIGAWKAFGHIERKYIPVYVAITLIPLLVFLFNGMYFFGLI